MSVPAIVRAGLDRCRGERVRVSGSEPRTAAEWVVRAERLAVLSEREARWWTVLERWTFLGQTQIPTVYGRAAMRAASSEHEEARFWRDSAADWRRRAAGEPVCGVIGCGCGGVCGVPA